MIVNRMLVTTCPDCETTFKLTVALLEKAGGQVRCGRCATVFDANSHLREQDEAPTVRIEPGERPPGEDIELAIETGTGSRWIFRDRPHPEPGPEAPESPVEARDDAARDDLAAVEIDLDVGGTGTSGDPALVSSAILPAGAEANGNGADADEDGDPDAVGNGAHAADAEQGSESETQSQSESHGDDRTGSATDAPDGAEAHADTEADADADVDADGQRAAGDGSGADADRLPDWLPEAAAIPPRRTGLWAGGAVVLLLLLGLQFVHAMRHEIAAMPRLGPALVAGYASLGIELRPSVDLSQYDTVDLTAVAEPSTAENGWLIIETRLQNNGPKVQAYPHIFVGLLDRWQETIAGRYFGPDEYMVTPVSDYSRMNVGRVVDAQFIIVDPGPSATGFVLEFCAPVSGGFACETE